MNTELQAIAQQYNASIGLRPLIEGHNVAVDKNRAALIALAYAKLPGVSKDVHTQLAYILLAEEIEAQWYFLIKHGYILEPWAQEGQPYATSKEMYQDVQTNKHLYFFTGGEPHPYLKRTTSTGYTGNEMLRAVHDIFGHAAEGFSFAARGEENAWIHHSMMFSPTAQQALTSDTRGQNSWVNFGPYKDLPACKRPFAEQKAALLPAWCWDWKEVLFAQ